MTVAAQTKEVVELAVGYTKQIVEALTPIAKQAYEIGLLTLQVDAASILIPFALLLLASFAGLFLVIRGMRKATDIARLPENKKEGWPENTMMHHLPADGVPHILGLMTSASLFLLSLSQLLKVWLWVKLFSPELWLAHQAVEKLLR